MLKVSGFATTLAIALSWIVVSCAGPVAAPTPAMSMASTATPAAAPVHTTSSAQTPILASASGTAGPAVPSATATLVAAAAAPAAVVPTVVAATAAPVPALGFVPPGSEMFFGAVLALFIALGLLSLLLTRSHRL